MGSNNLNGSIPESIGNLNSLQILYLDSNPLSGSIPESISKLSSLQHLFLSGNQLCGEIPISLMNLQLSNLLLDYNHLTASDPNLINWLNQKNPTWASTQTPCPQSQACLVYALDDEGLNNTQFFTINPDERKF
ncbi:MAG: hypothetical protein HC877_01520 [Thioploca sp.]|nr:hypothetical protein [Thioploca sp.]